jgi:hypothetical protein
MTMIKLDARECVHVYGVFALCFDALGRAAVVVCAARALQKLRIPITQEVTGTAFHLSMIPEGQFYFYGDGDGGFIQLELQTTAQPDMFDVYQYAGMGSGMRVRLQNVFREQANHPLEAVANFIRVQYDDGEATPTPAEVHAARRGML